MRLLRLVYEWPPPWIGLTPAPFELTRAQAKLGYKINVFCGRWPKAGKEELVDGVTLTSFFREPLRGTMLLTVAPIVTFYFLVWRIFNKVDVYHVHGHFGLYFYIYKILFGFMDRTPVISHFHICAKARWEESLAKSKKISWVSKYIDWPLAVVSDRLAVKVANYYVFVGEKVKEDVIKYYNADPSRCLVVESGVNPELFSSPSVEDKNKLKQKFGFSEKDIVVSNIGFLVERKNIHLLVESLRFLPENFKLMLVGKSDPLYMKSLDRIIEKYSLEKRVKILGEKDYPEIPEYYKASDIFCLPSTYEGFPKAVLEALSCGVPTVASGFEIPPIQGLLELKEFNAEALSKSIILAFTYAGKVESERVRDAYSWERRAETLDQIYNKIRKP